MKTFYFVVESLTKIQTKGFRNDSEAIKNFCILQEHVLQLTTEIMNIIKQKLETC